MASGLGLLSLGQLMVQSCLFCGILVLCSVGVGLSCDGSFPPRNFSHYSISITISLVEVYGLGGYGSIFPLNLPLSLPVVVSGMVGSMFGHTSCFNCTANFLIPFQIVWSLSRTRLIHWFG